MIPNLAAIVSVYAVARLASEYIIPDKLKELRGVVAGIAIVVIGVLLVEIISAGNDVSDLGL